MTKREQVRHRQWPAAALCALLLGLAGCVGATTPSTGLTPALVTLAPTTAPVSSPTAIVVLSSATPAPSPTPAPTEPAAPTDAPAPTDARFTEAQVIEVVDGDTIKVLVAGDKLTLRYIGIDTPEMSAADGAAARAQNLALVNGRTVRLEQDVSATDPYGRLLRYVWVGDLMVNAELVRMGYAWAVAYPPDIKHQVMLEALQGEAAAAGRGLWAIASRAPASRARLVQITGMRRDGAINSNEPDEYVEITNQGAVAQDLTGWRLDSERGAASGQVFHFPAGLMMQPGQVCRVYTDEVHPEWCGLNFGYGRSGVWNNNEPDAAVLFDGDGAVASRGSRDGRRGEGRGHGDAGDAVTRGGGVLSAHGKSGDRRLLTRLRGEGQYEDRKSPISGSVSGNPVCRRSSGKKQARDHLWRDHYARHDPHCRPGLPSRHRIRPDHRGLNITLDMGGQNIGFTRPAQGYFP